MEKLTFYEKVNSHSNSHESETSRGFFRNWRRKDYIANGARVLFVIIMFLVAYYAAETDKKDQLKGQDAPALAPAPAPSRIPQMVDLILLQNATEKGAVCLDGSAPGYHFSKGFDSGSKNWLLHLEGGGWCNTVESCSERKLSALGSSKFMEKDSFSGILSSDKSQNPEFFNWNKVKVRYCDGASFAGNPHSEHENRTKLFFRGQLIWNAVMEELLTLGMGNAEQALLSGCSAGGLATLIHCDKFAKKFPEKANVKCLSDAGFFMDEKDLSGARTMRSYFHELSNFQGMEDSVHGDCNSALKSFQCLFPRNFVRYIQTPVFFVNPSYDSWQIEHILLPPSPDHGWANCTKSITQCNPSQLKTLQENRDSMLKAMRHLQTRKHVGLFIDSCFAHCQTISDKWHLASPRINNKTIAEAVGDWYFNRKEVKDIDCPYPCNPTCDHKV